MNIDVKSAVKILGVYFTYDRSLRHKLKITAFKTPLTYRWLTRFRSMLSSAFLNGTGLVPIQFKFELHLLLLRVMEQQLPTNPLLWSC